MTSVAERRTEEVAPATPNAFLRLLARYPELRAKLELVKEWILREPEAYSQLEFGRTPSGQEPTDLQDRRPQCNTIACVAGWWAMVEGWKHMGGPFPSLYEKDERKRIPAMTVITEDFLKAAGRADMNLADQYYITSAINHLCWNSVGWPRQFSADYQKAKSKEAKAFVAAQVIDQLIATGDLS